MKAEERDQQDVGRLPGADTGNASNPTPHDESINPASDNQLLDERAETYLRESANIEDIPDAQQEQDADEVFDGDKP